MSEKDLRVFLCRLDTAMRAASCIAAETRNTSAPCNADEASVRASTHHRVVRVVGSHRRRRLRGKLVQLAGGDALVHAGRHLLRHQHLCRRARGELARCRRRGSAAVVAGRRTGSQNSLGRPHDRRLMRDVILSNETASLRPSRLSTYILAKLRAAGVSCENRAFHTRGWRAPGSAQEAACRSATPSSPRWLTTPQRLHAAERGGRVRAKRSKRSVSAKRAAEAPGRKYRPHAPQMRASVAPRHRGTLAPTVRACARRSCHGERAAKRADVGGGSHLPCG